MTTETDEQRLALALTMAETAVQDMAAAGLTHMQIAIGLAWHLRQQARLAMPTDAASEAFLASLMT